MAYVDLNPIRAKMAETPETSDFTSIQRRVKAALSGEQPKALLPFVSNERANKQKGLTYHLDDYLHLVNDTGMSVREEWVREDKAGHISH